MNLKNKVVLVTGSSRGIGRATALAFAQAGCHVVINYFKEKTKAESVVKKINSLGQKSMAIKADVADFNAFKNMVDQTVKKFGRLDILVNNAGLIIQTDQDYQKITDEVWDREELLIWPQFLAKPGPLRWLPILPLRLAWKI